MKDLEKLIEEALQDNKVYNFIFKKQGDVITLLNEETAKTLNLEYDEDITDNFDENLFDALEVFLGLEFIPQVADDFEGSEIKDFECNTKTQDGSFKLIIKSELNEGQVVSFLDYKNKKQNNAPATDVLRDSEKSLQRELKKFVLVDIKNVKVNWSEGRLDGVNSFQDGEQMPYDVFQKRINEYNYVLKDELGYNKLQYTADIEITQNGEKEPTTVTGRLYIGGDEEGQQVNLMESISRNIKSSLQDAQLEIIFKNDAVEYNPDPNNFEYATIEEYDDNIEEPQEEEPKEEPKEQSMAVDADLVPAKDYGAGKTAMDVEVGDILYCVWGYSMVLVEFYKVIKRGANTIHLQQLNTTMVSGNVMQGHVVPNNTPMKCDYVDGKALRISKKNYGYITKINGHGASYWNGKPIAFDYSD